MKILFENKYVRDKEWAKGVYGYIYFRRPIAIVSHIIFALYAPIGIYNSIDTGIVDWVHLLIPIAWFIIVAFIYNKNVKTVIKRDLELHGKAIEVTVTVADDIIKQSDSTGAEFQLNYRDIKKAIHTKKYIYLCSKTNMLYSLKRDSFSLGDADKLLLFMKIKGIKVK